MKTKKSKFSATSPARQLPNVTVDSNDPTAPAKITPPSDAKAGEKLVITYTNKAGQIVSTTATLGEDGKWMPENGSPLIVNTDGTLGLPSTETQQGSTISATSYTKEGNEIGANNDNTLNPNPTPATVTITGGDKAPAVINLPKDAEPGDEVVVTTVAQDGTTVTTTLTKQPDGTWKNNNPDSSPLVPSAEDPNVFTVPEDSTKDGSNITVETYNGSAPKEGENKAPVEPIGEDNETSATFGNTDPEAPAPNPEAPAPDQGSTDPASPKQPDPEPEPEPEEPKPASPTVTTEKNVAKIAPPDDQKEGDELKITYTPEGAIDSVTVTVTKTENGYDGLPAGATTDASGVITLPASLTKDGSPVKAIAIVNGSESAPSEATLANPIPTVTITGATETEPNADTVINLPVTDVEIGDKVKVSYLDPTGAPVEATLTKTADGWDSDNPKVELTENAIILTPSKTRDATEVTATPVDAASGEGTKASGMTANPIASGYLEMGDPGSNPTSQIGIYHANIEDGDTATIYYMMKGEPQYSSFTVTVTNGAWDISIPNEPMLFPGTFDNGIGVLIPIADTLLATGSKIALQINDRASGPQKPYERQLDYIPITINKKADGLKRHNAIVDGSNMVKLVLEFTQEGSTERRTVVLSRDTVDQAFTVESDSASLNGQGISINNDMVTIEENALDDDNYGLPIFVTPTIAPLPAPGNSSVIEPSKELDFQEFYSLTVNEKEVELDDTDNAVSYSDYFGEYGFANQDGVVTKLHFGKGNDTLYLDQDGVKVSIASFSNLEKIEATADNVTINVKAADLVANNSEIPLHINGDSSTTVDLGANNATNADNANVAEESTANLTDADGVWQKQASVEENDTAYDVYRHSTTEQEVYIQQGVEVI